MNLTAERLETYSQAIEYLETLIKEFKSGDHFYEREKAFTLKRLVEFLRDDFNDLIVGTVSWDLIQGDIEDNADLKAALDSALVATVTSPNTNDVLNYNGSTWINTQNLSLQRLILSSLLKLASLDTSEEITASPDTIGQFWYNSTLDKLRIRTTNGTQSLAPHRIAQNRFLGRTTAGSGEVEELVLNSILTNDVTLVSGTDTIIDGSILPSSPVIGWVWTGVGTLSQIPTFIITNGQCVVTAGGSDTAVITVNILV